MCLNDSNDTYLFSILIFSFLLHKGRHWRVGGYWATLRTLVDNVSTSVETVCDDDIFMLTVKIILIILKH